MSRPVDFTNPEEVRAFVGALRDLALDAIAAGEDATRLPRRRMFSRYEARRRIREAETALLALVDGAERSLHAPAEEEQAPSKVAVIAPRT